MDTIKLALPHSFIRELTLLTWREVLYGLDNELLAPGAAVDFAREQIALTDAPSATLLELGAVGKGEPTRSLVEHLATAEPAPSGDDVRDKWLYLVLAHVFEHRSSYPSPLLLVEQVYDDFGYPPQIASFVRYMPTDDPDLGSRELNEQRLVEKWKAYLDEASAVLSQ